MANDFSQIIVNKIAQSALPILEESRAIAGKVNNDMSLVQEMVDSGGGGKSGGTIKVRQPYEFTVRTGAARSSQNLEPQFVSVPEPVLKGVDFTITDTEKSKDFKYIAKEIVQPAVMRLASQIDLDILANYFKIPNVTGLPGTDPNSFLTVANAERRMFDLNAPDDGNRYMALNSGANVGLSDAMKGLFDSTLTRDAVRRGELGKLSTLNMMRSNNMPVHTTGTFATGSTPLVNGSVASGTRVLATDGWANSTAVMKAGDVFTIAGIFEVNPHTKQSTGVLKNFTCQSNVTSDGSGAASVRVVESDDSVGLEFDGQYQNMSAQIGDNAAITVWGSGAGLTGAGAEDTTYQQSIAFHKNCFWSGFFPLSEATAGAVSRVETNSDTGVSIRVVEQYDIDNAQSKIRLDVYHTSDVLCRNLGVRVVGS